VSGRADDGDPLCGSFVGYVFELDLLALERGRDILADDFAQIALDDGVGRCAEAHDDSSGG